MADGWMCVSVGLIVRPSVCLCVHQKRLKCAAAASAAAAVAWDPFS